MQSRNKKERCACMQAHLRLFLSCILLGLDSLRRTSVSASTAIYAEVGVDYILGVAFRDSLRGTLVNASTALDTVVSDYVSHSSNYLICDSY